MLLTKLANVIASIGSDIKSLFEGKVDKVYGKGLSDQNFTLAEKNKIADVGTNAKGSRTISIEPPTGGQDGDIWYRIE